MAIVKKYVIVIPADIATAGGIYSMTLPTTPEGFEAQILAQDRDYSPYEAAADKRQVWVLKGDDTAINNWITANSSMAAEKTFVEAETIGQTLQPAQTITVRKIITEDGVVTSEEDITKNIPAFDLQAELNKRGL